MIENVLGTKLPQFREGQVNRCLVQSRQKMECKQMQYDSIQAGIGKERELLCCRGMDAEHTICHLESKTVTKSPLVSVCHGDYNNSIWVELRWEKTTLVSQHS